MLRSPIKIIVIRALFTCAAALLFTSSWHSPAFGSAKEICIYTDEKGAIRQVNSRSAVPVNFRSKAQCFAETSKGAHLAAPEEIKLDGNVRREMMVSSLGRINLRWPRKVELLFGRTPKRAVADAATTASRALKASAFPVHLQTFNQEWSIVFMDEELPETQIPRSLISNCHPAWMTPPGNIYVVAQRVAAGCGGQKITAREANATLTHILLHEIGHAIEFELLRKRLMPDRMRSEGFASWFEQYSSDYSSIIRKGEMRRRYVGLAKQAVAASPTFTFSGSGHDYARASLYFHAIVDRRGVRTLSQVYDTMATTRLSFFSAIDKTVHWNRKRLEDEVLRLIK
ncbi:MAG: hypothetical protein J5J00_09760 [Deltaproteobacteria bacterium]|nr:hypothetical protein [Deltaproteobacteria bacterium]